jgi:hypothetical protein
MPSQKKEQALNGPGEPFLAYVHLVAHPVGRLIESIYLHAVGGDMVWSRREKTF